MSRQYEVVRIKNVGKEEWSDRFGGTPFRLAPGQDTIVPFDAICLWLGHPEAVDVDPRNRYRSDEYARLRVRYGVYHEQELWKERTPNLEVYDLDGNRIITVVDDPEGDSFTDPAAVNAQGIKTQTAAMEAMQRQMIGLQAQIEAMTRAQAAEDNGETVEDDDPGDDQGPDQMPVMGDGDEDEDDNEPRITQRPKAVVATPQNDPVPGPRKSSTSGSGNATAAAGPDVTEDSPTKVRVGGKG